ncbi:hypothetical protein M0811_10669 [Anaeramoeba ignava]|uniref:Uncharacterized protein n=1 Tax=Anaeramoeba ignava TaxID=1746090 RepID=A0A9Q0R815_ANAIG|nr:hypothetical protein M0811_10669 [Anaeramoeba ignava]
MYNLYLTEDRYIKILDISNQNNSFEFNSILHDFREYFLEGKYKTNPKYHQAKIILNQKYLGNCRIKLTNSHQLYLLTKNLEMHRIFLNIECKTMTNINNPKELRIETQKNTLSLIFSKVNECKIFEEKIVMNKRPQSPRKITTDSHFQGILYIIDNESFCEGSIKIQNGISSQICISQDDGQEIYKEKISDINIFSSTANKRLVRIQNAFGKEVIFSFLTEIARSQFLDQIQKLKEKSTEKEIKQEKELEIEIEIESEKEKEKEIKQEKEMHEIQRKISTLNELERLLNTHLQDFSENLTNYEVKFLSTDSISAAVLILEEDHLLINKNEQIINADYKTTKIYYHPRNNEVLRILIEKPSKISFVVKFFTHDLRSIFVDKFKRYKEFIMDSDDLIVSSTQKFFVKIIDTQKRFRGNGTFTFENIDNSSRLFLDTRIGILELKNQAQLSLSNDQGKFIKIKSDQNDSNRLVFLFNDQKKQNDFAILFANHLKNYLKSSDFLTLKNQLEFSVKWIKLENFQNAFGLISIQFETMTLIATCEKSIFNFKLSNISKLIQSNKRKTVSYIIIDSKHSLKIQFENQNQREKFQQIFEHCLTLI